MSSDDDRKALDEDLAASKADEALFRSWLERVKAGLGRLAPAEDDSPRMTLIHEIHESVSKRWPLGIAEDLYRVITSLHIEDDDDAITTLEDLAETERQSQELNRRNA